MAKEIDTLEEQVEQFKQWCVENNIDLDSLTEKAAKNLPLTIPITSPFSSEEIDRIVRLFVEEEMLIEYPFADFF